jgi:hypothetical protein
MPNPFSNAYSRFPQTNLFVGYLPDILHQEGYHRHLLLSERLGLIVFLDNF